MHFKAKCIFTAVNLAAVSSLQHIRDIQDPEHPYSLEQLNVVAEDLIDVSDNGGNVT